MGYVVVSLADASKFAPSILTSPAPRSRRVPADLSGGALGRGGPSDGPGIVALLAGTAMGAVIGRLTPGTSCFGKTYIVSPPIQAWATAALILVAVGAKTSNVKRLLGSKLPEKPYLTAVTLDERCRGREAVGHA